MKAADWIIDFLISKGVTDTFGLPGAVVLELLYAMDRRKPELTPHLSYHEQGAAFAACGYAQATGKLGVAYATRGPGMTNMLTAVADAYYDSVPVMFFTAHSSGRKRPEMRVENNQEIDTVALATGITKYAVRIDDAAELQRELQKAYAAAMTGRKGPVFLDIASAMLRQEITPETMPAQEEDGECRKNSWRNCGKAAGSKAPGDSDWRRCPPVGYGGIGAGAGRKGGYPGAVQSHHTRHPAGFTTVLWVCGQSWDAVQQFYPIQGRFYPGSGKSDGLPGKLQELPAGGRAGGHHPGRCR